MYIVLLCYISVMNICTFSDTELKKKLQSFNDQFQGQHQELEQLRSKIRQAESDRQLAVNKAKLLEEELNSQQRRKGHEDKLRQLEEERMREKQQRELQRQREEVKREQAQLVEQHKLLKHQMEMTKQQHERELFKKSQEYQDKKVLHVVLLFLTKKLYIVLCECMLILEIFKKYDQTSLVARACLRGL